MRMGNDRKNTVFRLFPPGGYMGQYRQGHTFRGNKPPIVHAI
jgi:hypothetical protein